MGFSCGVIRALAPFFCNSLTSALPLVPSVIRLESWEKHSGYGTPRSLCCSPHVSEQKQGPLFPIINKSPIFHSEQPEPSSIAKATSHTDWVTTAHTCTSHIGNIYFWIIYTPKKEKYISLKVFQNSDFAIIQTVLPIIMTEVLYSGVSNFFLKSQTVYILHFVGQVAKQRLLM